MQGTTRSCCLPRQVSWGKDGTFRGTITHFDASRARLRWRLTYEDGDWEWGALSEDRVTWRVHAGERPLRWLGHTQLPPQDCVGAGNAADAAAKEPQPLAAQLASAGAPASAAAGAAPDGATPAAAEPLHVRQERSEAVPPSAVEAAGAAWVGTELRLAPSGGGGEGEGGAEVGRITRYDGSRPRAKWFLAWGQGSEGAGEWGVFEPAEGCWLNPNRKTRRRVLSHSHEAHAAAEPAAPSVQQRAAESACTAAVAVEVRAALQGKAVAAVPPAAADAVIGDGAAVDALASAGPSGDALPAALPSAAGPGEEVADEDYKYIRASGANGKYLVQFTHAKTTICRCGQGLGFRSIAGMQHVLRGPPCVMN